MCMNFSSRFRAPKQGVLSQEIECESRGSFFIKHFFHDILNPLILVRVNNNMAAKKKAAPKKAAKKVAKKAAPKKAAKKVAPKKK